MNSSFRQSQNESVLLRDFSGAHKFESVSSFYCSAFLSFSISARIGIFTRKSTWFPPDLSWTPVSSVSIPEIYLWVFDAHLQEIRQKDN
jgi:hypothetical protein